MTSGLLIIIIEQERSENQDSRAEGHGAHHFPHQEYIYEWNNCTKQRLSTSRRPRTPERPRKISVWPGRMKGKKKRRKKGRWKGPACLGRCWRRGEAPALWEAPSPWGDQLGQKGSFRFSEESVAASLWQAEGHTPACPTQDAHSLVWVGAGCLNMGFGNRLKERMAVGYVETKGVGMWSIAAVEAARSAKELRYHGWAGGRKAVLHTYRSIFSGSSPRGKPPILPTSQYTSETQLGYRPGASTPAAEEETLPLLGQ